MSAQRARARRGGYVGRVAGGLASVDREVWNALVPCGSKAIGHGYLTAWEHSELVERRSRPVLVSAANGDRPVAACPGYAYDLDMAGTRYPWAGDALRVARRLWPRLLMARAYELGSPAPLTNPFLFAEGADAAAAVEALIDAATREAREAGARFMIVQNLTSLDGPAVRPLIERGFTAVPILPTAVVDLPYSSFDEYLGAMRSQYRRRATKTFRRSEHLSFEHLSQFADLADELTRLWRLVYERAREVKHELLTPAYFRAVSELDETSVLIGRRPDGSIASFALLLSDRPWLAFLSVGFEAESGPAEGSYFRLLYEIVRVAIEGGYEQVELGLTTIEPKLDIGAVAIPLYALVKHSNPVIDRLVRAMAGGMKNADDVRPRRVFKQDPPSPAQLVARRAGG